MVDLSTSVLAMNEKQNSNQLLMRLRVIDGRGYKKPTDNSTMYCLRAWKRVSNISLLMLRTPDLRCIRTQVPSQVILVLVRKIILSTQDLLCSEAHIIDLNMTFAKADLAVKSRSAWELPRGTSILPCELCIHNSTSLWEYHVLTHCWNTNTHVQFGTWCCYTFWYSPLPKIFQFYYTHIIWWNSSHRIVEFKNIGVQYKNIECQRVGVPIDTSAGLRIIRQWSIVWHQFPSGSLGMASDVRTPKNLYVLSDFFSFSNSFPDEPWRSENQKSAMTWALLL
jgi:hypothetical protein